MDFFPFVSFVYDDRSVDVYCLSLSHISQLTLFSDLNQRLVNFFKLPGLHDHASPGPQRCGTLINSLRLGRFDQRYILRGEPDPFWSKRTYFGRIRFNFECRLISNRDKAITLVVLLKNDVVCVLINLLYTAVLFF